MINNSDNRAKGIVYVVHAVDTEGPLLESLGSTFKRLEEIFGVKVPKSRQNLRKLQHKEIDLGGLEDEVALSFSDHLLDYNDNWEKLEKMLFEVMSPEFRNEVRDSFDGGWIFNWHCVDHVGYKKNPRGRDVGYHRIFDHYLDLMERTKSDKDGLHFHFHPMSTYQEAHRCATSFINSPELYQILCRRIIDRKWFPKVFRAGFQTERPDSNWFLEQWIPFDMSNTSIENPEELEKHKDLCRGRFGDWRLAPNDWTIYQPDHYYYQLKGGCNRWIARALNLGTRFANITQAEVDKAFVRAAEGDSVILGVTCHDFRNMKPVIQEFRQMLLTSSEKYGDVRFKFSEGVEAFNSTIYEGDTGTEKVELDASLDRDEGCLVLKVNTKKGKVFGTQPFLAIKTKTGRYIHDNFDFSTSLTDWTYTFDHDSILPEDVDRIGIACNDRYANSYIKIIEVR